MQINSVYDWVNFVANKYQSGAISAPEFNDACQVVAIELFNTKAGLPEQNRPGAPYPSQAYAVNDKSIDDLAPYINPDFPIAKNTAGFFPKPGNYYAISSLSYEYVVNSLVCGANPVPIQRFIKIVNDGEWRVRIGNSIIPPTLEYPIAKLTQNGYKVAPKQISKIALTYLQAPVPPVYGFTVVNDEYVYNPNTSTQLDFPATLHPEFAMRIVRYFSINIRDTDLEQLAQQRLAMGN